jgi:hypothetical protein
MEDFINPELTRQTNGIWQRHGFKIVLGLVALLLIICGYLIYLYYFSPSYQLKQLLPQNYDISFEFDFTRLTLPASEQRTLINNPAIGQIYLLAKKKLDGYLSNQPAEIKESLTKLDHFILFFQAPNKYGIIANISNKNLLNNFTATPISDWNYQILKNQILIAANNETLLKEMSGQKLVRNRLSYLTIYSGNWLKIDLQSNFFKNRYSSQLLVGIQNILRPIADKSNHYSLDITAGFKNLELLLIPEPAQRVDSPVLDELLGYLPNNQAMIFGLTDLTEFKNSLENNNNFKTLFQLLDNYCWKNWQISLSNLIKTVNGPIIVSFNGKNWRIITIKDNQNLANSTLRKYFGQFKPKIINLILPDGSKGQKIIADTETVKFNEFEKNGWNYSIITDYVGNIGYASHNNTLIIGNNLGEFNYRNWHHCQNNEIVAIFSLIPNKLSIGLLDWLNYFNRIDLLKDSSAKIKSCLEF